MVDLVATLLYRRSSLFRVLAVLFGAVLIHLTIGTYHTFGNMLPYMASYMRNYTDPSIRLEHMMWIPTFQGCFPFAMVIGGWISLAIGPRFAAFIGCSLATTGVALSYYTIRYSLPWFTFSYGLMFGLGQGIAYVVAVTSVINWAPDKVGLLSGIVAAGFGLSSSIFAPIQTELVNPTNLPPTKEGYFLQAELLQRVPGVFLKLSVCYAIMQLIGLVFICDPPEKKARSVSKENLVRNRSVSPLMDSSDETDSDVFLEDDIATTSGTNGTVLSYDTIDIHPRDVLRSSTFYLLFIALFCCSFYANMFYNLYKTYAETFIEDDFFMAMAFSIGSVVNAIARIAWGYLTDKTSFQITVSIATCSASVLLLTLPMTKEGGKYMFLLWLCGIFICMGATHALFITAMVKCFGSKYKAANYGLLTFSTTCSGVLLSIISEFYLSTVGYSNLWLATAIFPFCAFVVTSLVHKTKHGEAISF